MKKAFALLLGLLIVSAIPSFADDVRPPSGFQDKTAEETKTIQRFGEDNATCAEWSDGCVVCTRRALGPVCSVTGIACQPKPVACGKMVETVVPH